MALGGVVGTLFLTSFFWSDLIRPPLIETALISSACLKGSFFLSWTFLLLGCFYIILAYSLLTPPLFVAERIRFLPFRNRSSISKKSVIISSVSAILFLFVFYGLVSSLVVYNLPFTRSQALILRAYEGPWYIPASQTERLRWKRLIAANRNTPPHILRALSSHPAEEVREKVAGNRATPEDVLQAFMGNPSNRIRFALSGNYSSPPHLLRQLLESSSKEVRLALSQNHSAPPDVLRKMQSDRDLEIQEHLARNPRTPMDMLTKLSQHPSAEVRSQLAYNEGAPKEILHRLACDKESAVRHGVSFNNGASPEDRSFARQKVPDLLGVFCSGSVDVKSRHP